MTILAGTDTLCSAHSECEHSYAYKSDQQRQQSLAQLQLQGARNSLSDQIELTELS